MRVLAIFFALLAPSLAQQTGPPIKINILNVCAPSTADQKDIAAALERIPRQPRFAADFEVARGHTTLNHKASDWVRIRRDMAPGGPFTAAQFVYTREGQTSRETSVFFSGETKGVTQIAIEDSVTSPVQPAVLLTSNTPASRISLERANKPHIVLARCPDADQSAMEPLFQAASQVIEIYRGASGAREIVPAEVDRLSLGVGPGYRAPKVKPMEKR
jgi:hypothetical protein